MASGNSTQAAKTLQYTRHGLRMVGERTSLFDLNEPVWHADEKSPKCDICGTTFSLLNRRHHCRRCGEVICGRCSDKQPLVRMGFIDPVLVCTNCVPTCKSEEEFYRHHLKLLMNGAYFTLSDTSQVHNCKLNSDHDEIVVSNHAHISMTSIMEVKSNTSSSPESESLGACASLLISTPYILPLNSIVRKLNGSSRLSSLEIIYQSDGTDSRVIFSPSPKHSHKQSIDWLKALKKGLVLLHKTERRLLGSV